MTTTLPASTSADSPARAAAAYRWSFISLGTRTALQAISGVLVARAVSPASFGAGMLVVSLYLVASALVLQGANGPLVVRSRVTPSVLRRVLLADLALAALAATAMLVAGFTAPGLDDSRGAMALVAAGCLVLGFGGPGRALAARELAFRRTAIGETAGSLAGAAVAVGLASATGSAVLALPLQIVIVDAAGLVATAGLLRRPVPDLPAGPGAEPGVRYAVQTASNQLASIGSRNAPNWVVAATLGSTALGIYSLAYRLMMLPVQNVAMVLGRVLLPRLRRMGGDDAGIQRELLAVLAAVALVVGPFTGALLPHLHAVVTAAFGDRWGSAATPTGALLVAVFPQCCTTIASSLLAARGHGGEQLRMTLSQLGGAVVAAAVGSAWGIDGVAAALAIAFSALAAVNVWMVRVRAGVAIAPFGRAATLFLVCAAAAAAVAAALPRLVAGGGQASGPLAAAGLVAGGAAGLAAGLLVMRDAARRGIRFWLSMART